MSETAPSSEFADRIQHLFAARRQHADAIAEIDQSLQQIRSILDATAVAEALTLLKAPAAKPKAPAARPAAQPKASAAQPAPAPSTASSYGISAQKMLLDFVRSRGNPTTQEIQQNWSRMGRKGSMSPDLARLIKAGKLTRSPIPGQRASRYRLAAAAGAQTPPAKAASSAAPPSAAKAMKASGQRKQFARTGQESILAFVKQQKNPTTQQINRQWKAEGRGGTADKTLGKLVKDKKLKRQPVKDGRGSRYSLA